MRRRPLPGTFGCFAAAALAAGAALAVCATSVAGWQADTQALEPKPLGVMTFNIRTSGGNDGDNAWPHRRGLVAETIARAAPDVAGLQEALDEQIRYLVRCAPGLPLAGRRPGAERRDRAQRVRARSSTGATP